VNLFFGSSPVSTHISLTKCKKSLFRALDDIVESIEELKYYKEKVFHA
jgi:oligoribonuclease (3'-5' exoribonuclease)